MDRREYLLTAGTVGFAAIAGCADEDDDDDGPTDDDGLEEIDDNGEEESTDDGEEESTDDGEEESTDDGEEESTDDGEEEGEAVFEFTGVTTNGETFSEGDEIPVGADIENTGSIAGEQTIRLQIGDETLETNTELEPGEETTVGSTFEATDFTPGTWEYTFSSDNDEISGSFEIEEPAQAIFEFTEISPGDESVEQGESIAVSATVENTGDGEGTQEINLEFGDKFTSSLEITLEPGEESFPTQEVDTGELDISEYDYTFSSEDDEISATLTVTEPTVEEPESYSFSGTGQSVESGIEIEGGLTVIEASHNGSSNFQVSLVDDSEFDDNFINVIGEFDGAQADLIDSGEYVLDVNADGSWDIDIRQPRAATGESLPESLSGSGPDVIGPIQFSGTHIAEGTHGGSSNFQVEVYPMEGRFSELVFNEIGEFEGETTFSHNGVGWVDVNADGNWTVDIE